MGLANNGDSNKSALSVNKGVEQPPSVNPDVISRARKRKKKTYLPAEYVELILEGNRTILSQVITLLESSKPEHYDIAQHIVELCLPYSENSFRIGITGVPGVGKSTFIEALGKKVTSLGHKLAVLTVDPSSMHSGGSILGDKTRMETLSSDPNAFIRPSPSAGSLGGVARKTRETIIVCEAAGFDTIFVETVGVGQSETHVNSMVDFFLLLMLAGAGDELQGIKRGIMEMADTIAITKADGTNRDKAEMTRQEFGNALRLFPPRRKGWTPKVVTCSAVESKGVSEIWSLIEDYRKIVSENGSLSEWRMNQAIYRMHETISENLKNSFYNNKIISEMLPQHEELLRKGKITSYTAAVRMIEKYFDEMRRSE